MPTLFLIIAALTLAPSGAAFFSEAIAAVVGAYYLRRSDWMTQALLNVRANTDIVDPADPWRRLRGEQRLLARHFRQAIRMTALFGQHPDAARRGYAIMRLLGPTSDRP